MERWKLCAGGSGKLARTYVSRSSIYFYSSVPNRTPIGLVVHALPSMRRDLSSRATTPGRGRHALETTCRGVFAIGDVRAKSVKRVAAAVGEGAQVVAALHAFLAAAEPNLASSAASTNQSRRNAGDLA